jgi:hypothetical protein
VRDKVGTLVTMFLLFYHHCHRHVLTWYYLVHRED